MPLRRGCSSSSSVPVFCCPARVAAGMLCSAGSSGWNVASACRPRVWPRTYRLRRSRIRGLRPVGPVRGRHLLPVRDSRPVSRHPVERLPVGQAAEPGHRPRTQPPDRTRAPLMTTSTTSRPWPQPPSRCSMSLLGQCIRIQSGQPEQQRPVGQRAAGTGALDSGRNRRRRTRSQARPDQRAQSDRQGQPAIRSTGSAEQRTQQEPPPSRRAAGQPVPANDGQQSVKAFRPQVSARRRRISSRRPTPRRRQVVRRKPRRSLSRTTSRCQIQLVPRRTAPHGILRRNLRR